MDLPQFLRETTINRPPPRAPRALLYIPPSGRPIHCPDVEVASKAAQTYSAEKPGVCVAVYQLVGYAFRPIETPEFTPVDSDKARRELLAPLPDTLNSDVPAAGADRTVDRPDLTSEQQETLDRMREAMREATREDE